MRRNKTGVASLELAVSAFILIVFSALWLDVTLITYAMQLNDACCRDAARAAAQQSDSTKAILAAQSQMAVHSTDGFFVQQPFMPSALSPDFVYQDYSGKPPASTSPYVTVTTAVNIKLPAPIFFFGAKFMQSGTVQFKRRYTYPIIKEKFYQ